MGWNTKCLQLAVRACEGQYGWWQKYRIITFIFMFKAHAHSYNKVLWAVIILHNTCVVHRKRQWATIRSWRQNSKRNIERRKKRLIKSHWGWHLWPSRMRQWLPCEYTVSGKKNLCPSYLFSFFSFWLFSSNFWLDVPLQDLKRF